jgi:hypothetical protein
MEKPANASESTIKNPVAALSEIPTRTGARPTLRIALLASGIAAAVWWVAIDVIGSLRYPGYSYADQTISELSAVGAPTRTFMMTVSGIPYAVLMIAFGVGVWAVAGRSRAGRFVGALLVVEAIFGYVGGVLFPMATREVMAAGEETLRNRLHVPYGMGMPILFILVTFFGSRLFGWRFRWYSYATIIVTLSFGFLTGMQSGQMQANEPTPWLGVVERITAYTPMLWIVVLAVALLRVQPHEGASENRDSKTTRSTITAS